MEKYSLLGVNVDAITIDELNYEVIRIIKNDKKMIISNHNLHSVYLVNKNKDLIEFWEKSIITHIDGMPLIWWGKILGYSVNKNHRITYLDWVNPLMELANNNSWKIYYLGGSPGVANRAIKILSSTFENITFQSHSGYFDISSKSQENIQILNEINSFKPNILMVGMGMPRQEKWILDYFDDLHANVVLNSGACFDYIAGEQKAPPRFLGKIGLEWFYRLINDPKRLSRRYLVEPLSLFPLFVKDINKIYFHRL